MTNTTTFIYSNPVTFLRAAKLAYQEAASGHVRMSGWSRKLIFKLGTETAFKKGQTFRGVTLWVDIIMGKTLFYSFLISEANLKKHLGKVPKQLQAVFTEGSDSLDAVHQLPKTRLTVVPKPGLLPGT